MKDVEPHVSVALSPAMERLATRATSIKAVIGAVIVLVGAAASIMAYFGRFALGADLKNHIEQEVQLHRNADERLDRLETRSAVMEAMQKNVEADLHWLKDQSIETARRVGAPVVAPISHKDGK